ncbi:MAG: DUF3124 domain-containing protein [Leptolyngbyaceae cyanobacterium bins.349]|nr:DUF3124 domain-containing protein [Leptolyngbyaceae cyanobacterium bins.349]
MKILRVAIALVLCVVLMTACTTSQTAASSNVLQRLDAENQAVTIAPAPTTINRGQVVYVPAYSHIYHGNGIEQLLTITLSVRNTSLQAPIFVRSLRYYDSGGVEVKNYSKDNLRLGPLATAEFLVPQQDRSGGSGANFMVEWVAAQPVSEPVIEAVMISTSSQQGIAFVSSGKVIEELSASQ